MSCFSPVRARIQEGFFPQSIKKLRCIQSKIVLTMIA
jgi:hypothetical protein